MTKKQQRPPTADAAERARRAAAFDDDDERTLTGTLTGTFLSSSAGAPAGTSRRFRSTFPALHGGGAAPPRIADREEDDDADAGEDSGTGFRTRAWKRGVARSADELVPLVDSSVEALFLAGKDRQDAKTRGFTFLDDDGNETDTLSFHQLSQEARSAATALEELGVKAGDRVLLVLPTGASFLVALFGCQIVGAVPVPTYPPAMLERAETALERLQHVVTDCSPVLVVTDERLVPLLGGLHLVARQLKIVVDKKLRGVRADRKRGARVSKKDIAFIQYTSGSTGHPKGVVVSQQALMANCHALGQAGKIDRSSVVVSWLPLYHDMGLVSGVLWAVYWRLPVVLMSPTAFLMNPRTWLAAIGKYRGTHSCAPNFAYARCEKRVRGDEQRDLDLSSWRVALSGAEPVNAGTLRAFERQFAGVGFRAGTFVPSYGLAENVVGVASTTPGTPVVTSVVKRSEVAQGRVVATAPGDADAMELVSCGQPLPGHEVWIVDEAGGVLPEREVGHVVVLGPSVMRGYYNQPERTAEVVRRSPVGSGGKMLWTGDLGFLDGGQLFLCGRAKDLVIVRGKNHYATDIEDVVEGTQGVKPGASCAFGVYDDKQATDLCVVVIESAELGAEEQKALADAVSGRVSEHCGLSVDEVVFAPRGSIPKTSSGKKQRSLCREHYLRNELGPRTTSKLKLAVVLARSGVGHALGKARALVEQVARKSPD